MLCRMAAAHEYHGNRPPRDRLEAVSPADKAESPTPYQTQNPPINLETERPKGIEAESSLIRDAKERQFQALMADLSSRQQEIDSLVGNERQLYMTLVASLLTAAGAIVVATGLDVAAIGVFGQWLSSMVLFLTVVLLWLPVANSRQQLTIRLNAIYIETRLVPTIRQLCGTEGDAHGVQIFAWEGFAIQRMKSAPVIRHLERLTQVLYVSVLYIPAGVTFGFYLFGTNILNPGAMLPVEILGITLVAVEFIGSGLLTFATYSSSAIAK